MTPDLPYYRWNFNTSTPLTRPRRSTATTRTARAPDNDSRWNTVRDVDRRSSRAAVQTPPVTEPDIWYSYRDNPTPRPLGTPCQAATTATPPTRPARGVPAALPRAVHGRRRPHGATKYEYDPDNPSPTKFPPYYDGARSILGEFTQDTMREVRLDSQNRVFKINPFLDCGAGRLDDPRSCSSATTRWTCSSGPTANVLPADLRRRLLQRQRRRRHVPVGVRQGPAAPKAVIGATPTDGRRR